MSLNANQASSPEGTSISWLTTPELCSQLGISRSTLRLWCRRGVLREGQHWIRMNPSCPHSNQLWQPERCASQLNRQQPHRRH